MLNYIATLLFMTIVLIGCGSETCCSGESNDTLQEQGTQTSKPIPSVVSSMLESNLLPTALITVENDTCKVGDNIIFDGRTSLDKDGYISLYTWSQNEDIISVGAVVTLPCESEGNHSICLEVTDDDNETSDKVCHTYTVVQELKIEPIATITDAPVLCTIGDTISIVGELSSDEDGEVVDYSWVFGEQTSQVANPNFVCKREDAQTLCLTVFDNDNLSNQKCTTIIGQPTPNKRPVAKINVSSHVCVEGDLIHMSGLQSYDQDGLITQYQWNSENLAGVENDFNCTTPGDHVVCLTVVDDKGFASEKVCENILVSKKENITPVANIVNVPTECTIGDVFVADGTTSYDQDGIIATYLWAEDDNMSVSTEAKPIFSCDEEGNKKICLTVSDNDGAVSTNEECKNITVKAPEQPVATTIPPFAIITLGESTGDGIWLDCSKSYDPDLIDGDNNSANDAQIVSASWNINKVVDGVTLPPHSRDICKKWVGTPDNLDYMKITLTVTDDDGQTSSTTQIYDWIDGSLILR